LENSYCSACLIHSRTPAAHRLPLEAGHGHKRGTYGGLSPEKRTLRVSGVEGGFRERPQDILGDAVNKYVLRKSVFIHEIRVPFFSLV
jgi:hypothetical protein